MKTSKRPALDTCVFPHCNGKSRPACPEMNCPQYSQLLTSWAGTRRRLSDERKANELLREALSKALSYCDAAVHQTEQYHDEREALHQPLGLPEAETSTADQSPKLPIMTELEIARLCGGRG